MEFISRTQLELSIEQESRERFIKFVENDKFVDKIDTIFENHKKNLVLMDDLTRQLLVWENTYARKESSD